MIIKLHIFVFKDYGIVTYQYGADETQNNKAIQALMKISEANYLQEIDTCNLRIPPSNALSST